MSDNAQQQPEGSAETPGPDATSAEPTQQADPGDFQSKIMQGGESAWEEFRKQQASASRANARLRDADLAVQIAERLGNGDLKAGGETALKELMQYRQMRENPALASLIERWQRGERIEDAQPSSSGSYYDPPAEADPRVQELQALQGDVAALKTQIGMRHTVDQITTFMRGPLGSLLNATEQSEALDSIQSTLRAWGETPVGRDRLVKFSADDAETIVLKHLARSGKLLEVGRRDAQQRSEEVRSRETDVPSRLNTNGASRAPNLNESLEETMRIVRQQMGVH